MTGTTGARSAGDGPPSGDDGSRSRDRNGGDAAGTDDDSGTPRRVALDANVLMAPVRSGVRVFEELDRVLDGPTPVVPAPVRAELADLAAGGGETARAAGVGADLADRDRCAVVDTDAEYADDALVELARQRRVDAVATDDDRLADRVHEAGLPVVATRNRSHLTVESP